MPSAAFRFRPASAALLLALGLGATCCGTSVQAQGAWASGLDEQDALPGSASALPAGVRRLPDVPYGPDARQRIDVYLPAHPHTGRAPMLVFVHGGAWMAGDRVRAARLPAKLTHWVAERGWVVVSVGYRLVPRVTVPTSCRMWPPLWHGPSVERWAGEPTRTGCCSWGIRPVRIWRRCSRPSPRRSGPWECAAGAAQCCSTVPRSICPP